MRRMVNVKGETETKNGRPPKSSWEERRTDVGNSSRPPLRKTKGAKKTGGSKETMMKKKLKPAQHRLTGEVHRSLPRGVHNWGEGEGGRLPHEKKKKRGGNNLRKKVHKLNKVTGNWEKTIK